jgi:hypothetical protein
MFSGHANPVWSIEDEGQAHELSRKIVRIRSTFESGKSYFELLTQHWRGENAVLVAVYDREALWLAFDASMPHAIQVEPGGANAVSGEVGAPPLSAKLQNYMVAPPQRWLLSISRRHLLTGFATKGPDER